MIKTTNYCFFRTYSFANPLTTGQSLPTLKIKDQFEKEFTIDSNIKTIIFSASKTEGTTIKEFLLTKDKDYLTTNKAVYVADITGMPSIITSLLQCQNESLSIFCTFS